MPTLNPVEGTTYLEQLLATVRHCMTANGHLAPYRGPVHVGVDLGTAYTVLLVLDEAFQPVAGSYRFAQVVRDGLVVDFHGAIRILREMKTALEEQIGFELTHAASAYPPGVAVVEARATDHVLGAAGLECSAMVDEPSAANAVLRIRNGAVVDVGGGTTGIAVVQNSQVIYTADEPTGGTHFTLVVAGALKIPFEEAEALKIRPDEQRHLFPLVRPVMEKVASIIARHVAPFQVEELYLVGGTASFQGMDQVIAEYTGLQTYRPPDPLFVTPLGIAMHDSVT